MKRRALLLLFVLVPLSAPLAAAGFGLFQHGGRGAAQVGAFVARADDPSAVRYNPAGVARLEGLQFQAGLDFQAPKDQLDTAGQSDLAHHVIQFPPALYATWKPEALGVPLTFGFSLDAPFWTITNWDTALFPGRFQTIRQETTLFELRPTLAWAIDERWSLGGSLRYVRGGFETSFASLEPFQAGAQGIVLAEIHGEAASQVDGLGFDLGVQYVASRWGWGAVFGSGVSLDGGGDIGYFPRDAFTNATAEAAFNRRFVSSSASMNFELPPTAYGRRLVGDHRQPEARRRHRLERLVGARPHPHRDRHRIPPPHGFLRAAGARPPARLERCRQPAPRRRVDAIAAVVAGRRYRPRTEPGARGDDRARLLPGGHDGRGLRRFLQSGGTLVRRRLLVPSVRRPRRRDLLLISGHVQRPRPGLLHLGRWRR